MESEDVFVKVVFGSAIAHDETSVEKDGADLVGGNFVVQLV